MKSLKKKRRIQVIALAFVALGVSTVLIGYAMRDGINFFRSPSEVAEAPPGPMEVFKLGGLVVEGSLVRGDGDVLEFAVTDGAATIPVFYDGSESVPDLFSEGQGTIATGRYQDGRFVASQLLAKHDETYMPREVQQALEDAGHPGATDGAPITN
ncbi:cytochrome c maturation protein CcmE [Roseisalinus antarcticus]|uniref:Cytochrome c-type biogenesis protein CcmE n=1 Tax=Roseisalinus antarcticus TaxID=254357 RepID=A0A1Y5RGZ3_9RHOB|nr:cytochrome c maturation protein CcmE [Roseisalinus antarcticus]SLN16395.1 Cytochrome c-type biogenesis protein CcmE [Roseisalinus antarcticus]